MAESNPASQKRSRSPGYPAFSLPEAIRKAELLYRFDKRNPVPLTVAAEHWGYSPTSSAVLLSAATLKKFGLLEEVGGGSSRLVKLTDRALHILLSVEGSQEWVTAVREAALCPPIHAELWQQYGADTPSDANLKRILIMEKGFGDEASKDVIREYKETISFAQVKAERTTDSDGIRNPLDESGRELSGGLQTSGSVGLAQSEKPATLRRYAFPLADQPDAELYLPVPMTEDNYLMLTALMQSFLSMSKPALIAKKPNHKGDGGTETD
jgi:hypothetical protein